MTKMKFYKDRYKNSECHCDKRVSKKWTGVMNESWRNGICVRIMHHARRNSGGSCVSLPGTMNEWRNASRQVQDERGKKRGECDGARDTISNEKVKMGERRRRVEERQTNKRRGRPRWNSRKDYAERRGENRIGWMQEHNNCHLWDRFQCPNVIFLIKTKVLPCSLITHGPGVS